LHDLSSCIPLLRMTRRRVGYLPTARHRAVRHRAARRRVLVSSVATRSTSSFLHEFTRRKETSCMGSSPSRTPPRTHPHVDIPYRCAGLGANVLHSRRSRADVPCRHAGPRPHAQARDSSTRGSLPRVQTTSSHVCVGDLLQACVVFMCGCDLTPAACLHTRWTPPAYMLPVFRAIAQLW
jgi:hypothetical protein